VGVINAVLNFWIPAFAGKTKEQLVTVRAKIVRYINKPT